jgi:hypothetical protein
MKIKEIVGLLLLVVCAVIFFSYHTYNSHVGNSYGGLFEVDHPHIHDLIHQQNETIYALTKMLRAAGGNNGQNMLDLTSAINGASGQIEDDKSRTIAELDATVTRLKQQIRDTTSHNLQGSSTHGRDVDKVMVGLQEEVVKLKTQLVASGTLLMEAQSKCEAKGCSGTGGGVGAWLGASKIVPSSGAGEGNFLYADDGRPDYIESDLERDCSNRYGRGLLSHWKGTGQEWCSAPTSGNKFGDLPPGSVTCYPYHQTHKKLDGRPPDMFCEGRNIAIDFTKVSGAISTSGKPPKGSQYLQFREGNTIANCQKTAAFKDNLFMPHQKLQLGRGGFSTASASMGGKSSVHVDEVVEKTTYLLARDEDCENTFHSTADFMNMYFVMSLLGLEAKEQQVLLWDKFGDGPYAELIQKAFSPATSSLLRHTQYGQRVVLFKRVVWHLESPAGLIFPRVANPDPMRCHNAGLFVAYRKYVLQSFGLYNQLPPTVPSITVSLRRRTKAKNVGRVMGNEAEVEAVLREGNMLSYQMVDFGGMSFGDQLRAIRSTNILVGIHGVSGALCDYSVAYVVSCVVVCCVVLWCGVVSSCCIS